MEQGRRSSVSNKRAFVVVVICVAVVLAAWGVLTIMRSPRATSSVGGGPRVNGWAGSTCSIPDFSLTQENQSEIDFPTSSPSFSPISAADNEELIILESGEKLLTNQAVPSLNGRYCLELTLDGDLILSTMQSNTLENQINTTLWRKDGGGLGATLSMQDDGNLVFRTQQKKVVWRSGTSQERGATLRLDDRGRFAVISKDGGTPLWMQGVPGGRYNGSVPVSSLELPIRGAFYYPWFPETWSVNGASVFYEPTLGKYSNGNRTVQSLHIAALEYAHVDLSIASWWGPGRKKDRARITNLMDESIGTGLKWSVYHEQERREFMNITQLQSDLDYLKKWFVWHEAWAFVDGKPVIFVYNANGCDVTRRWVEASNCEWYVVLKVFKGYRDCPYQPEGWHQYGPATAALHTKGFAYTISPGFWEADDTEPRLPRLTRNEFQADAQAMVDSGEPFQLITTFNEWGEGTSVESASEWESFSGNGEYMDVLNEIW